MIFNKRNIENLQLPAKDKLYYQVFRDDKLAGFCLRVACSGTKTFIIDKKVDNKLVRFSKHPIPFHRLGNLVRYQQNEVLDWIEKTASS